MKHTITEIVKGTTAEFSNYRDGNLYYSVVVNESGISYTFPIDITDTTDIGNATFEREIKAITLMRYIRKAIEANTIEELELT